MRKLVFWITCLLFAACQTDSDIIRSNALATIPNISVPTAHLSLLEQIKQDGFLVVVTRTNHSTYYIDGNGQPTGFEYDLAERFANKLGVELVVITTSNFKSMIPILAHGSAHIAAAGLTVTKHRDNIVRFSEPYQYVTQSLVYRSGRPRPRTLSDLNNGLLEVVAGSSYEDQLHQLLGTQPSLRWSPSYQNSAEGLLSMVWAKKIDYTIINSNQFALSQRSLPELRVAFNVSEPIPIAWAFPPSIDVSLYLAANEFLNDIKNNGELDELLERYYGHTEKFNYASALQFIEYMNTRLPNYQHWFKASAKREKLDWRLLAAIGYQESHWNPKAISPTGVRGIMMLTRNTAKYLHVKNRTDAKQSIDGGGKFYRKLYQQLPNSIQGADRTWMALAAYNVGYGHLMDARLITSKRGGDKNKWKDVRANLPLLKKKKWYRLTRYGYARGNEPVTYVDNIRQYYDTLIWYSEHKQIIEEQSIELVKTMQ